MAEDTSLRLTSLVCFVLTALLLWGLVRYVAGPVSGVAALVAFTFTPFAFLWSRTSMIEYLATAGAVGFAFGLVLWRDRRRPVFFALALAAGLVGMLVKPTTAVFWILPALLTDRGRAAERGGAGSGLAASRVAVPLLAAALWTRHADAIKAASPVTEWLTGWNLRRWNFGWPASDSIRVRWKVILQHAVPNLISLYGRAARPRGDRGLAVSAVALLAGDRERGRAARARLHEPLRRPRLLPRRREPGRRGPRRAGRRRAVVCRAASLARGGAALCRGGAGLGHGRARDGLLVADPRRLRRPIVMPLAREIAAHTGADDPCGRWGWTGRPQCSTTRTAAGHMVIDACPDVAFDLIHRDGYRYLARRAIRPTRTSRF